MAMFTWWEDSYDNLSDFSDFEEDCFYVESNFDAQVDAGEEEVDDHRVLCSCSGILSTEMFACSNDSCPKQCVMELHTYASTTRYYARLLRVHTCRCMMGCWGV